MIDLDLVYVTYNSEKWIDKCFSALYKSNYDLNKVNIFVVDNNSSDDTLLKLNNTKNKYKNTFGNFSIIKNETNSGFGVANNIGVKSGTSPFILFLNIDTELFNDSLLELSNYIENDNNSIGIWELRQFPNELPKYYDPLTFFTNWSSGAAFAVKRDVFNRIGGFDSNIFMYAEDVDLSWKIREAGYHIKYCVNSKIHHYTNDNLCSIKPNAYLNCFKYNLLLRYRYGNFRDVLYGHCKLIYEIVFKKSLFSHSKKQLFIKYIEHFSKIKYFLRFTPKKEFAIFNKLGYGFEKDSGSYPISPITQNIHLNIFVLDELYEDNLKFSIENQTYKNFSVYKFTFDLNHKNDDVITFDKVLQIMNQDNPFLLILDDIILFPDHFETLLNGYDSNYNFIRTLYCIYPLTTLDVDQSVISNVLFKKNIFDNKKYLSVNELKSDLRKLVKNDDTMVINKSTILKKT